MSLFAVLANRFDRATFHRLAALFFFFRSLGLFIDEGIAFIIGTSEITWCCLTAQIAVDAGGIDVVSAGLIEGETIGQGGHG